MAGRSQRRSKFGPFVISLVLKFAADPWVAAALSVWQPEQLRENVTAAAWNGLDLGTVIFCVPQAVVRAATAKVAPETRSTLTGRRMRAEIIRNNRIAMPRLRQLPSRPALAVTALALVLAGCAHTVRVGGSRALSVALTEYQVTPENVRAYAGSLTITVRNLGTRTHSLYVTQNGQNDAQSPDLPPGATTTMTVDLQPGKYMMRSTVPGDQALGMWGTLNVIAVRRG